MRKQAGLPILNPGAPEVNHPGGGESSSIRVDQTIIGCAMHGSSKSGSLDSTLHNHSYRTTVTGEFSHLLKPRPTHLAPVPRCTAARNIVLDIKPFPDWVTPSCARSPGGAEPDQGLHHSHSARQATNLESTLDAGSSDRLKRPKLPRRRAHYFPDGFGVCTNPTFCAFYLCRINLELIAVKYSQYQSVCSRDCDRSGHVPRMPPRRFL